MTNGASLTNAELEELGVKRKKDTYGRNLYEVPCAICGRPVTTRQFSTNRIFKCDFCKKEIKRKRNDKVEAARRELLGVLADDLGTDYEHLKRFENGASKFGDAYADNIEAARKAIDKFDSVPEVVACIELLHIGARVIAHQKVGDFTVDFCLPDDRIVVEVDGSIYHADEAKEQMRDYAIMQMLGDGWEVRHVPSDAIMKNHAAFGNGMRRMLNARKR